MIFPAKPGVVFLLSVVMPFLIRLAIERWFSPTAVLSLGACGMIIVDILVGGFIVMALFKRPEKKQEDPAFNALILGLLLGTIVSLVLTY